MAAGIATLKELKAPGFYEKLETQAEALVQGLKTIAQKTNIPVSCTHVGGMLGLFFNDGPVRCFVDAKTSNLERFTAYYQGMLENGVYLAPSQFEAFFLSLAHDEAVIQKTLAAAEIVFSSL
jgi:glutamate-1-semialdehyde 2,1-aminomutase